MRKNKKQGILYFFVLVLLAFCLTQAFAADCGDVDSDGTVDIVDALLIAQYYVNLNPANFDATVADVDGSGDIDIVDALLVAQFYVGLIDELTGCEPEVTPGPETPTPTPVTGEGHPDNDQDPHGYGGNATGGGNASPQTVTSASAFSSAVSGSGAAVIIVNGDLNTGNVTIGSNKTIIGANGSARIRGGTVNVSNNVIIKNLIIGGASGDAMEISGSSNIFIHKCTFVDGGDGSCDIVRAADNVTLSWCRFYYTTSSDHRFPILIGNSDGATGDRGKLHVTIHHTWFDNGCIERLPRVRFGYVHLYNNYYASNTTNYCIGLGKECHVQVENSYFDDQPQLWYDWGGSSDGIFGWNDLHLTGQSTIPGWMDNDFPAWSIPYSYTLDPAESTRDLVMTHAGSS